MKRVMIYNYDSFDNFYINAKEKCLKDGEGIPAFSTELPPPNDIPDGFIAVFNTKKNQWEIVKDEFWHVSIEEINYYTGSDTHGIPMLPTLKINQFPNFKCIPQLFNSGRFSMYFISRIDTINEITKQIYAEHYRFQNSTNGITTTEPTKYKNNIEFVVYLIRKSIDELITLTYCLLYYEEMLSTKKLKITSIGDLLDSRNDKITKLIKDYINYDTHSEFLEIINSIHNSMKHDIFSSETVTIFGESYPTIITLQANWGNLNKIKYHNHSYGQIILGFSNFLLDLFANSIKEPEN
ncbi:hypothetical protein [Clostridium pasteurianum]|uniref:Uncharacterized protein n=1 Tax=Clostridium pasteurianum BC1 TaxID=86416 RepID=R4K540_CLOPA|nr:hypothetical protein [Clostridium pasteurianum]AGK95644.1 hypothetical protein Clopa_0596 [Clostridium pasteurianum BC1]